MISKLKMIFRCQCSMVQEVTINSSWERCWSILKHCWVVGRSLSQHPFLETCVHTMSLPQVLPSFSQESEETCEETLREILWPKVQCQLTYSEAIWLRAGAQQKRTLNNLLIIQKMNVQACHRSFHGHFKRLSSKWRHAVETFPGSSEKLLYFLSP